MLKYRVLTAAVLIPIFLLALFFLPPLWFCLLTAAVLLLAAWEWSQFMGLHIQQQRLYYVAAIFGLAFLALLLPVFFILSLALIWWIVAIVFIVNYPKFSEKWSKGYAARGVMGLMTLVPTWLAINLIRTADDGAQLLLFVLLVIWSADTAAYFAGKRWGKNKLAPQVSPGKTREGLYAALACSAIVALLGMWALHIPWMVWPAGLVLAIITVAFSVVGDLLESMLKRVVGLKDSSNILPGHGGILDRIDSLTAALPIFALGGAIISKLFH